MHPDSVNRREFIVTPAAVDRIILRANLVLLPALRDPFEKCLQICLNWYSDADYYNYRPAHSDIVDFARSAAEAAEQLLRLLERGEIHPPRLTSYSDFAGPLSEVLPPLRRFREVVKRVSIVRADTRPASGLELDHFIDWYIYADHFRERTAFEWLAGLYLCELYELFVDSPPKGHEFISFVRAVLEVFNVKTPTGGRYSKEAISRARRLSDQLGSTDKKVAKARRQGPIVDADVPDQMGWYRHMALEYAVGMRFCSGDFIRSVLVS